MYILFGKNLRFSHPLLITPHASRGGTDRCQDSIQHHRSSGSQFWQDGPTGTLNLCGQVLATETKGHLPANLDSVIADYKKELAANPPELATRISSQNALNIINPVVVETIGGSADLTSSNNINSKDMKILDAGNYGGRYIHYGVREHGMAAAVNGLALHGGVIPYGGTFFCFTD